MPWGLKRFHESGQTHFITFTCYHRFQLLESARTRRLFEVALERVRRKYQLCVYGYVVMPEHVHLLLSEPEHSNLAQAIKSLKQGVAPGGPYEPILLVWGSFAKCGSEKEPTQAKPACVGHRYVFLVRAGLMNIPIDVEPSNLQEHVGRVARSTSSSKSKIPTLAAQGWGTLWIVVER